MVVNDTTLYVDEGPHAGETLRLSNEIIHIGRAEWCDLQLSKDMRVSSLHCELHQEPDGIRLVDRNSLNGVMVVGCRVYNAMLPYNLPFRVGDSVLRLQSNSTKTNIQINNQDSSGQLVGQSPRMRQLFAVLSRLGRSEVPVLFLGETGTGKSSIALALHQQSSRSQGPFVTVNCGALATNLIESELFGHEKGAFTGADQAHPGFFEQADGGTLFLDEIGELPLEMQPKLLDILERKKVRRLGGTKERDVSFRLVTATHRNLRHQVEEGTFREDLYYRLAVMELTVPSLRERLEDLPMLAAHLLQQLSEEPRKLSQEAVLRLKQHLWPGNVRELRNILERSLIWVDDEVIPVEALETSIQPHTPAPKIPTTVSTKEIAPQSEVEATRPSYQDSFEPGTMDDHIAQAEEWILRQTLEALHWNVSKAMRVLNVSRSFMYGRLNRYNIERPNKES